MRTEANKKMVYLHVSAYKTIITELRDEIGKLKTQLNQDLNKAPIVAQVMMNEIAKENKPLAPLL
jgi:hypothetical protein